MKKFLFVLLLLFFAFGGYILYDTYFSNKIPVLKTEEEIVDIDKLFVYGTHLNLHGNVVNDSNLDLVLYNGDFLEYKIKITDNDFDLAEVINDGIYLENIPIGTYYAFLRSSNKDENGKDVYKYYTLNNKTKYDETVYYTFSNTGNKIVINTENDIYNTLMFTVSKNTDKGVYDIVIDAGHGGMDSGAIKNGYKEADMTMELALSLKEKLEKYGVSVKLTREKDQLTNNEKLNDYGIHGRAVIPHEVNAKYVFSLHMNSNSSVSVNGLEVYTPANINYDFAKKLVNNITTMADIGISNNKINKKFNGIYTRTFTEEDIANSKKEHLSKNMVPYEITTKTNYYFMIRETGGIMTGAYVDKRNEEIKENPYFDSNVGVEAYLLELGYLSNKKDLDNIINNLDKFTDAISMTFKSIYETVDNV